MAGPLADFVVSLGMDGRVASHGSELDAVAESLTFSPELERVPREEERIDQEGPDARAKLSDGKLILAEEIAEGRVSWDACNCQFFFTSGIPEAHPVRKVKLFFRGLSGSHAFLFWIVFLGGLWLCEVFVALQTWLMGYWAEQYVIYPPESVNVALYVDTLVSPTIDNLNSFLRSYLTGYGLLLLAAVITYATGSAVYIFGTVRASRTIHGRLIEAILGTTLRYVPRCSY